MASNQKFCAKLNIYSSSALKILNNTTFEAQTRKPCLEFVRNQ